MSSIGSRSGVSSSDNVGKRSSEVMAEATAMPKLGDVEEITTRERKDGLVVRELPKGKSRMSAAELSRTILRNSIPRDWKPRLASGDEGIDNSTGGWFAVSEHFFSVGGLRLPYVPIVDGVCADYQLRPSQIPSNGWRFINGLALLCHQFGYLPSVNILQHFLRMGQHQRNKTPWSWVRAAAKPSSAPTRDNTNDLSRSISGGHSPVSFGTHPNHSPYSILS